MAQVQAQPQYGSAYYTPQPQDNAYQVAPQQQVPQPIVYMQPMDQTQQQIEQEERTSLLL